MTKHLADVDAALKAVLDGPAELERLARQTTEAARTAQKAGNRPRAKPLEPDADLQGGDRTSEPEGPSQFDSWLTSAAEQGKARLEREAAAGAGNGNTSAADTSPALPTTGNTGAGTAGGG